MSATSLTPSAKRKRTDAVSPKTPVPVRRSVSEWGWMDDGNIVLQVESTHFRVNRGILVLHSMALADIFSVLPDEPEVEGCPVVILSDSAEDWERFLRLLYDPFNETNQADFGTIAAMLRLGRKYNIKAAQTNALRRIQSEFPTNFEAWNRGRDGFTMINDYYGLGIDLLNLAYELGINSSIPTIGYYCLHSYKLEVILTTATSERDAGYCDEVILPQHVKRAMAIAFGRMMNFQHEVYAWLEDDTVIPSDSCRAHTKLTCTRARVEIRRGLSWNERTDSVRCYALDVWDEDWNKNFCHGCAKAGKKAFDASCARAWEALPTFFGLSEWGDLKDTKYE